MMSGISVPDNKKYFFDCQLLHQFGKVLLITLTKVDTIEMNLSKK